MKKFKLADETKTIRSGEVLHRIEAIKDFGDVKKGQLGGWIQRESNLSQDGNCWIYDDAEVCQYAQVYGEAQVYG
ncbi:MAG: hypothetical protein K2G12_03135 [Prevotella sp.]|nr:hypothetical protein [Prevotella sp.]